MSDEYGPYDLLDEIDLRRYLAENPEPITSLMFDVCASFSDSLDHVVRRTG